MSLRGRLLVLMVLMNLLVLGIIGVTTLVIQDRWMDRVTKAHLEQLFLPASAHTAGINSLKAIENVREILALEFGSRFRDILIRKNSHSNDCIDLNPLGSASRDHATFPYEAIRKGIQRAIDDEVLVRIAGGTCTAIRSPGRSPEDPPDAGVWFLPIVPDAPETPFFAYAVLMLSSLLLFLALAGWVVGRTLGQPLLRLGSAVRRVESGDYTARMPQLESAPELANLVETFNAMAEKVEGHTDELQTEVRRATEEAAAKERALVVSARLASMGTLAAGIAHEVNNPIGGMLNAVHRLAGSEHLSERDRTYIRLVQQGLERVANTSRKLLDFSPRVLDPIEFELSTPVAGARALVEHQLRDQRVVLRCSLDADLPAVMGDPHEIQQVLLNLFLNSLNALEGVEGRSISVFGQQVGDRIVLRVEDDGPGVDKSTLDQVLDPFFSGSNHPDATGLGLFISFTIIQNHGGQLSVSSASGEGFGVRIELPFSPT
jgi:signal transduction histidine kinase